ncbi:hypothetical protein B0J12DRAFT_730013 [Macrophomina phaseolina]|uniref:AMP-dependent synthetase/ligase domain-containing protein n=1 Tax=Macrophomina phaseolina TaxID=35725 RepID=A0ABQ8G8D8_9PEZI|nr:hypothetical protein B0J12DRAFT_730013 [Macrophomina phaseolina]
MLDPAHPMNRIRLTCARVDARVAIVSTSFSQRLLDVIDDLIVLDRDFAERLPTADSPVVSTGPKDAAYVIFTPGSSGEPEGVIVEHRSFAAAARGTAAYVPIDGETRALQFASYSFGASLMEIMVTLIMGGCLCVWADRVNLFTLYGSAEQSVTSHGTAPLSPYGHSNEIGRPFPGSRSWIVDPTDGSRFVPVGAVGELVVEGPAVAREYMQDTDKTRGAFPAAFPWRPAFSGTPARFCRTGDLVKYGADGDTLDVGRRDGQIKLRGQRIELGEMEYLPSSVPALSVEIVVPRGEKPDKATLAAFVALGDDYEGDDGIDVPSTTTRSPQPSQALYPRLRSALNRHAFPTVLKAAWAATLESLLVEGAGERDGEGDDAVAVVFGETLANRAVALDGVDGGCRALFERRAGRCGEGAWDAVPFQGVRFEDLGFGRGVKRFSSTVAHMELEGVEMFGEGAGIVKGMAFGEEGSGVVCEGVGWMGETWGSAEVAVETTPVKEGGKERVKVAVHFCGDVVERRRAEVLVERLCGFVGAL